MLETQKDVYIEVFKRFSRANTRWTRAGGSSLFYDLHALTLATERKLDLLEGSVASVPEVDRATRALKVGYSDRAQEMDDKIQLIEELKFKRWCQGIRHEASTEEISDVYEQVICDDSESVMHALHTDTAPVLKALV